MLNEQESCELMWRVEVEGGESKLKELQLEGAEGVV